MFFFFNNTLFSNINYVDFYQVENTKLHS